jgi:SAM-dependent methyltransferase
MRQDRIKWNEKFRRGDYSRTAAGVVKQFYHLAPGRKALDIAAGSGRNTVFLAGKGFSVDAVDISEVGLGEFAGSLPNIQTVCADLDRYEIAAARYDLIVNVKFLNRRLFPYIRQGLKPGGLLIFQTLLAAESGKSTPDHCRDYLLRQNELLHAFIALRIIYYRESFTLQKINADPTATLVAVRY